MIYENIELAVKYDLLIGNPSNYNYFWGPLYKSTDRKADSSTGQRLKRL
jgi:hypothetical protein